LASLQLLIVPAGALAAPTAPSNLAAAGFSTTRIDLTWSDNSGNETSFQLYRAPDAAGAPGAWTRIATLGRNVRSYADTGRSYATRYWYRVRAVNQSGNSAYSNSASGFTLSAVSLQVSGFPVAVGAGAPGQVSVSALDAKGNPALGYPGTIRFASSDAAAGLPGDATLPGATATFMVTLKTAGTQAISAQDTVNASVSGTQGGINVSAGAATRFTLTYPASVMAGNPASAGVTAYDTYNNVATGYRGTVAFSSTSALAALPAPYTFAAEDAGAKTFPASLNSAGSRSISVADQQNAALSATVGGISVSAAAASRLTVQGYPASIIAGIAGNITVTALDTFDNIASGYAGTVRFSSSDARGNLPANSTLSSGTRVFPATLLTAGTQSISVQDTGNASLSGTQGGINVSAGAAATLTLTYPASVVAGNSANLGLTAYDIYNNVATGYRGTVAFSSTSALHALPAQYTFTAGDGGTRVFSASLNSAGSSRSISVADQQDAALNATVGGISVSAADATRLALTYPAAVVAGNPASAGVTAYDAYNNVATGYQGTVAFSSTSALAALPAQYTFAAGDAGSKTFPASLNSAGTRSISVGDQQNAALSATVGGISVSAGPASRLTVQGYPASIAAGTAGNINVTALDSFGNVARGYTGTVRFSSTDARARLPQDSTLALGSNTLVATFLTAGAQDISAQDTVDASLSGTQSGINVTAGNPTRLTLTFPASVTAGTPASLGLTAYDAYNNVATGYRGTVSFSSTSALAALPEPYTFVAEDAGTKVFSASLNSAGTRSISATDPQNAALSTTLPGISVGAGAATRFAVQGFPASITAGTSGNVSVTAFDGFGNLAAGYAGTVRFSSSDTRASLPADSTLTSGTRTFAVGFFTAGMQNISVQDTVNASAGGTQSGINVSASAAVRLGLSFPASVTAGSAASLSVTAFDAYDNVATGYRGSVGFSSSAAGAALPAQYAFAAADAGTKVFSASLFTAGVQSISARDAVTASVSGSTNGITVIAANAARFALTFPGSVVAGVPASLGVAAVDAYGNPTASYLGTIAFSSTSALAALPAQYTFTPADGGSKSFAAALNSAGVRSITAFDAQNPSISATLGGITVSGGLAATLSVQGYPSLITAGTAAAVTVSAVDAFGNIASGYSGTVSLSSTDPQARLPLNATLSSGSQRVMATFRTAGVQSITAQDAATALPSATQSNINVTAAPSACVGGTWQNIFTRQHVQSGLGLRETPTAGVYGTTMSGSPASVVLPQCPYFSGTVRLPILLVDWSDFEPATDNSNPNNPNSTALPGYSKATPAEVDAYANGPSGAAQYFRDVSGGKADMQFDVFGWIDSTTPGTYLKPRASYITYNTFQSQYNCDRNAIYRDALKSAVVLSGADTNNYDSDGNSVMDGGILLYEGHGGLCSGGNLSWLSGQTSPGSTPPAFYSPQLRDLVPASDPNAPLFANLNGYHEYYNNIPERVSATQLYYVATWVHELGHLLLGYPDYYYSWFNLGSWGLSGSHGPIPTHPAAFEKWMFAHWLEPQVLQTSGQYALAANEIPDGSVYDGNTYLYQILIDGDPRRFITIENRWFDDAGNTATQWAGANGRESGLQIIEFNLGVNWFSTNPPQLYRNVPERSTPGAASRSFGPGDSFSKCYQTMCVTIDQIGAPGEQVQFSVTITPPGGGS
jgi:M6 family metalloprotease-like protein